MRVQGKYAPSSEDEHHLVGREGYEEQLGDKGYKVICVF